MKFKTGESEAISCYSFNSSCHCGAERLKNVL